MAMLRLNRVFSLTRFRTTASLSCAQNHHSCALLNPCGAKTVRKGVCENTLIFLGTIYNHKMQSSALQEIIGGVEGSDRKGRDADKMFLYDIVNNTRSGLDVDKIGIVEIKTKRQIV